MNSFLSLIAADMLAHFTNDMRDVTVVFPGKRAGMFLSRELALLRPPKKRRGSTPSLSRENIIKNTGKRPRWTR